MLILVIFLLGGIVLYRLNPTQYWFMPKCPLKQLTGLNCPGCGIQRAIHALVHGKFAEAISYNYYLVYSGPYAASFAALWLMEKGKAHDALQKVIENKFVVLFYIISFVIWFIVRNILSI